MAADDTAPRPARARAQDGQGAEVVRSEEQLRVRPVRQPLGRVRIAKRVVTEERTVTVVVRREELVVEEQPLPSDADLDRYVLPPDRDGGPVVELTLSEEQVRTEVVVVPRERVRVFVDRVTGEAEVTEVLAREVVAVEGDHVHASEALSPGSGA